MSRARLQRFNAAQQSREPFARMGLRSAAHRHSASKTRVNALTALRRIRGTIPRNKVRKIPPDRCNFLLSAAYWRANNDISLGTETVMIDRRILLASIASLFGLAAFRWLRASPANAAEKFEIEKTDAEWRAQLTPQQYEILRKQGTERPGSSPLLKEHRKGIFACAGCDLPLFSSETKFESGTGWPSFYQPLDNAVGKTEDRTFGMLRTEIHCRRCGGHLGHVFDDGPKPTGLRYCMDGFALVFHPAAPSAT